MKNLDEILKETDYTKDEKKIYQKVQTNIVAQELERTLTDLFDMNGISISELETAKEKAELIISRFEAWSDNDWTHLMPDAIFYVLRGV